MRSLMTQPQTGKISGDIMVGDSSLYRPGLIEKNSDYIAGKNAPDKM